MVIRERVIELFRTAVAGKEIPPPEIKVEFNVFIDGGIDDDPVDDGVPELECIGRSFGIAYIDSKGQESRRRITVKSLRRQESDLLIGAYCHERHATRAFKASRIQEVVDLETGEVVNDAAEVFGRYLSEDPTYEVLRACGPILQVLTFIARCDGEFHFSEKDCIVDYVLEMGGDGIDSLAVEKHIEGLHPDFESFERGLELTADKGPTELSDLVQWLKRVVDADGVLAEQEFEWLVEVEELIAA